MLNFSKLYDINDCTPNAPARLIEAPEVLDYYNRFSEGTGERYKVDEVVKSFFCMEAMNAGWSAMFFGHQCFLNANVAVVWSSVEDNPQPEAQKRKR